MGNEFASHNVGTGYKTENDAMAGGLAAAAAVRATNPDAKPTIVYGASDAIQKTDEHPKIGVDTNNGAGNSSCSNDYGTSVLGYGFKSKNDATAAALAAAGAMHEQNPDAKLSAGVIEQDRLAKEQKLKLDFSGENK